MVILELRINCNKRTLVLTRGGRFMKGRALDISAFKEVTARLSWWTGAKADAEPARKAAEKRANFMVGDGQIH